MTTERKTAEIGVIGLNHRTAPVEVRERLSLPEDAVAALMERGRSHGIEELVYLGTCNRVELYFTATNVQRAGETLMAMLESSAAVDHRVLEQHLYRKYSRDAATHLLSVTSAMDSMVVGESEIVGQVKEAYRRSVEAHCTGPLLNRLFHQAFKTAKRVRTETEIAQNPLSIAFIATELAKKIFEDLSRRSALLIGAGDMGELILKYFTKHNIREITIANRSLHNAERIAEDINRHAHCIPLEDIPGVAARTDIIIASAGTSSYLITASMGRDIARARGNSPLFMIDIGVPRNIEPSVSSIEGVFLYNIDDLRSIADENLKNRLKEVEIARQLVEDDADEFMDWYDGLEIVPLIAALQDRFEEIRRSEFERYRRRKLKHLSVKDAAVIEELTRQIMTKTMHNPIQAIKRYQSGARAGRHDRSAIAETIKIIEDLFGK